jgi:hypothetical protein
MGVSWCAGFIHSLPDSLQAMRGCLFFERMTNKKAGRTPRAHEQDDSLNDGQLMSMWGAAPPIGPRFSRGRHCVQARNIA